MSAEKGYIAGSRCRFSDVWVFTVGWLQRTLLFCGLKRFKIVHSLYVCCNDGFDMRALYFNLIHGL